MGLQIWLPLQGNLKNKGLSKVTLTTSGTPTIEDGKIGQCYTFNENSYLLSTESFLEGATKYSLCCWFKSDYEGTAWKRIMALGNHTRAHLDISPTTQKVRFFISKDGTSSVYSSVNSTTLCHDGQWHHVCGTFDNGKIKLYIDGVLEGSATGDATTYTATGGQQLAIGAVTNGGGMFKGSINDVRVYDECLSPMQVKLISQGLVAHYLLNNNGGGNNNLALNSYNLNVTATKDNKNISNRGTSIVQLREDGFYETKVTGSWGGISIYANSLNLQVGDKITFSFYIYINGSSKAVSFYPMMYNSSGTRDTSSRLPISVDGGTYTTLNSKQIGQFDNTSPEKHYAVFEWNDAMKSILDNGGRIELSIQISGTWQDGDYVCLFAPKLEYGDKPTPWCPNSADSLATQLGYNSNIEYDVSGYCNNGTKYNITDYISNSPRYSVATKFNGTNSYINIGREGMVRDEITINIWAYMEDWTTYNYRLISCTQSGGWNFEKGNDGIHFTIGTGATSNTYKNTTNYPLADLASGWHMFTGSYDGFQNKMYIDGVLAAQNNSPYTTKTPIYYNSSTPVLIGAEANQTQSPAGSYFDGYMSDVRIYATALSESDLQSLYNNSGFLDSSGNIYATEYTES